MVDDVDKIEKIAKDIKKAKKQKVKIPEYLSKGDIKYYQAITAIRRSGYWGVAGAVIYIGFAIFFLCLCIASIQVGSNDMPRVILISIIGIVLLAPSIFLRIYSGKIYKLLLTPKKMKSCLIANIIICIVEFIVVSVTFCAMSNGAIIICPGLIVWLSVLFSILALNEFTAYQEWFEQYSDI